MVFPFRKLAPASLNRAQRRAARKGRGSPAVFEALEQRLLLNADVLALDLAAATGDQGRDILIKMTDQQATQPASQRIQILDLKTGQLLADRDRLSVSSLALNVGRGDDRVTIDRPSFGATALAIKLTDTGGKDRITIRNADNNPDVNGETIVTGNLVITQKGFDQIDTGYGPVAALIDSVVGLVTQPQVTKSSAKVTIDLTAFNDNVLLKGTADGGLQLSSKDAKFNAIFFTIPASEIAINMGIGNDRLELADLPDLKGTSLLISGGESLVGGDDTVTITGSVRTSGGALKIAAETVLIGSAVTDAGGGKGWVADQEYAGLTATTTDGRRVTVDVTTDKAGLARAHLAGAIQGIAVGETLTVADPRGQGGALTMKVVANAGAITLDTSNSAGKAGDITISGATIDGGPGNSLRAVGKSGADGAVSLVSDAEVATIASALRLATLPYDSYNIAAGVRLSGVTIEAGDVTLTSEAIDAGLGLDLPPYIENAFTLLPVVQELLKVSVPDLTSFKGIAASVILRNASAETRLHNDVIVASGNVELGANAVGKTELEAAAGAAAKGATKNLQVAVGIGRAGANAYAALTGGPRSSRAAR